jgi:hypothetical protein
VAAKLKKLKQSAGDTVPFIFESIYSTENCEQTAITPVVVLDKGNEYFFRYFESFFYELRSVLTERE